MPLVLQPNLKQSQIDKNVVADIAVKLNIARPLAEVLYTRGYNTVDKALDYFDQEVTGYKDPYLLRGMKEAVEVLKEAISTHAPITVYGDYDVDGICAVAILFMTLRVLNADVHYYIPDRHLEGYGLNAEAVKSIAKKGGVLVTVDCGITSVEEVELAKKLGLKVIVTDHHTIQDKLPDCIIINPKMDSPYGFKELCGAGVAFKLAHALLEREDFISALADFACIATVADLVPLVDENRYIVKKGLEQINFCPRLGINELILACGKEFEKISESDISFGLAPRLNAAGRLGNAKAALEILLGENVKANVQKVCELNAKRQELEQMVVEQAEQIALKSGQIRNRRVIVAASETWDKGVIGIAASKLTEKYHRPCLLFSIADGIATGSGRSISGIDLFDALSCCNARFIKFGGHAMAAGLSLRVDELDSLSDELNLYMIEKADPKVFFPIARYDAKICLAEMNAKLVEQMRILAPFGIGNPMPRFRIDGLRPQLRRVIGKSKKHLKVTMTDDATSIESVLFSYQSAGTDIKTDFDYTVIGYPEINNWNNIERVNLIMNNVKRERNFPLLKDAIVHNDDLIFRAFFEQIMYDTNAKCDDFQHIENKEELIELIDNLLSEDDIGTLIICNQPRNAIDICKHVFDNHPRCDIDMLRSPNIVNGYNTLLVGGSAMHLELDAYKNIVLCDCSNHQIIDYINKNYPHAEVYAYIEDVKTLLNCCRMELRDFSRNNMVKIYLAVKKHCADTLNFDDKDEFLRSVSITSGASTFVIDIALEVFAQLGFLELIDNNGDFKITFNNNSQQNPLTNSSIYCNLVKTLGIRS